MKIFVYERMNLRTSRCMSIFIDFGIFWDNIRKPALAEARYEDMKI